MKFNADVKKNNVKTHVSCDEMGRKWNKTKKEIQDIVSFCKGFLHQQSAQHQKEMIWASLSYD